MDYFGRAGHAARGVFERGNAYKDGNMSPIFRHPDGLEPFAGLALSQQCKNVIFFFQAIGREKDSDRFADNLFGLVPE